MSEIARPGASPFDSIFSRRREKLPNGGRPRIDYRLTRYAADQLDWPPNLWMGVSIEDADVLDRVGDLRKVPAAVRFLSCEPLLGSLGGINLDGIHWVIAGGESGPEYRPVDPQWVRHLRDACVDTATPFFFKQWGGRTPKAGGRVLDGREWSEYPTAVTP